MQPLTAERLLHAWERGRQQRWPERALTLLAASDPHAPADSWSALSIGERDRRLLLLRAWAFGPTAPALVTCPGCGEQLEFDVSVAAIAADGQAAPQELRVAVDGWEVRFRVPTSGDLAMLPAALDVTAAERLLLSRCVIEAGSDRQAAVADALPDSARLAVLERMAQADPLADIRLASCCPACAHEWAPSFDVLPFFWAEIEAWAARTLRDVHQLASAYGWREADILAMSAGRRSAYLELVGA